MVMSVGRGRRWMPSVSADSQETPESLGIADNCGETTDRATKAKEPGAHKSGIVEVHVVVGGDIVNQQLGRGGVYLVVQELYIAAVQVGWSPLQPSGEPLLVGVNLPTSQLSSHRYIQMTIIKTTTNNVTNTIAIMIEIKKEKH